MHFPWAAGSGFAVYYTSAPLLGQLNRCMHELAIDSCSAEGIRKTMLFLHCFQSLAVTSAGYLSSKLCQPDNAQQSHIWLHITQGLHTDTKYSTTQDD